MAAFIAVDTRDGAVLVNADHISMVVKSTAMTGSVIYVEVGMRGTVVAALANPADIWQQIERATGKKVVKHA